jgi:hypothetical protein
LLGDYFRKKKSLRLLLCEWEMSKSKRKRSNENSNFSDARDEIREVSFSPSHACSSAI